MQSVSSVALSGIGAASMQMGAAAHNIANMETPHFRRQQVAQAAEAALGGVTTTLSFSAAEGDALANDLVQHKAASYQYIANLRVIRTQDRMMGSLLDMQA
ncbi:MAG: flagellar basal body rod protein [Burkholderiales bacterium]|nr:flagellar basal body rod protein [Burkholderiales bacterium]